MMDGWLNIYKPKGISSAKAVSVVKRILKGNKIGHTGTLDVEAEGVLPLAIGEATKLVKFLIEAQKKYIFTVEFGKQTDTGDFSGSVINTTNYIPSEEECVEICQKFIGTISQIPPAFSALKLNGVRAYKLAREGRIVELQSRNIQIYDLKLLKYDATAKTSTYEVICSKGTYVRTLAEDIALSLQSLGYVIQLRRESVGIFTANNAININTIQETNSEAALKLLIDKSLKIETVLDDIPVLNATKEQAMKIKYGQKCFFEIDQDMDSIWIKFENMLLAIGSISKNCFNSSRVFNLNKEIDDVDYDN